MGKIIRNGIEYSGTYDSADSVNYDNSNSGLNARTVQEGIDRLSERLSGSDEKYVLIGSQTGIATSVKTMTVQDITQYRSVCFVMYVDDIGYTSNVCPTFLLLNATSTRPVREILANGSIGLRVMSIYTETNTSLKVLMSGGSNWNLDVYGVK